MYPTSYRPRPGTLTLIGIVSLIWSAITLLGTFVGVAVLLLVGAGSWFAGPVAGAIGSLIVGVIITYLVVSSILSILLLQAGIKTLKDDPRGLELHRLWAWISLALDVVGLLLSGGTAPNSWTGIVYAIFVLYVTSSADVLAYYGVTPQGKPAHPGGWQDDLA